MPWTDLPLYQVRQQIGMRMPTELRHTWERIHIPAGPRLDDCSTAPIADWLLQHGPAIGARPPHT
eukprot:12897106-Prorocentrum_lima.AAC.1